MPNSIGHLTSAYCIAKRALIFAGFDKELEWQDTRCLERLTEQEFLREGAWVILSAGMRETVIRARFPEVSSAFLHWRGAAAIVGRSEECTQAALEVYGHTAKIRGIVSLAECVATAGFENVRARIQSEGVDYLETLDFIGPVTKHHLAKNIGLDISKPDRHLQRIAEAHRLPVETMCQALAADTGDKVSVVDLVLWRFATLQPDYLEFFAPEA